MNAKMKVFSILSLAVIVALFAALAFTPSAYAFDERTGDKVVIGKDEVIDDDLYIGADEILVEGTINGDLMAFGEKVTITGEVTGDLWAAGREVNVNGKVGDDLFVAATAVTLGSTADIADDVFSAGLSVETRQGSQVGGSLLLGAYQGLVSGNVAEDWLAAANRLRLESTIAGDARLAFDSNNRTIGLRSFKFGSEMLVFPIVPAGLTFGSEAQVLGSLEYTSSETVSIPSTVATDVQHFLPPADQQVKEEVTITREQKNGTTTTLFNGLRRLIALLLVTALLAWLVPMTITLPAAKLQSQPWQSLGTGCLGIIAIPLTLFFAFGLIALVAILIGALTLGELLGTVLGLGLPALALAAGLFFTMLGYLPQAMVAYLGGRWFLRKMNSQAAGKVIWPALLGALVLGVLIAIPVLGWILEFVVVLFGLGAIILVVWERMKKSPATSVPGTVVTPSVVEG